MEKRQRQRLVRLCLLALFPAVAGYGCDNSPPASTTAAEPATSNRYIEAVQEAEALKHTLDERYREQLQRDQLLKDGR
jgi:hypothetical protein